MLFAYSAVERLVLGVRVNVDQPGQYQAVSPLDDPVRRRWIIRSDEDNGVVGKCNVDISAIDMAPGHLVPGNYPAGVSDDGRGHNVIPWSIIRVRLSALHWRKRAIVYPLADGLRTQVR